MNALPWYPHSCPPHRHQLSAASLSCVNPQALTRAHMLPVCPQDVPPVVHDTIDSWLLSMSEYKLIRAEDAQCACFGNLGAWHIIGVQYYLLGSRMNE